jgi:hypothetical protein
MNCIKSHWLSKSSIVRTKSPIVSCAPDKRFGFRFISSLTKTGVFYKTSPKRIIIKQVEEHSKMAIWTNFSKMHEIFVVDMDWYQRDSMIFLACLPIIP